MPLTCQGSQHGIFKVFGMKDYLWIGRNLVLQPTRTTLWQVDQRFQNLALPLQTYSHMKARNTLTFWTAEWIAAVGFRKQPSWHERFSMASGSLETLTSHSKHSWHENKCHDQLSAIQLSSWHASLFETSWLLVVLSHAHRWVQKCRLQELIVIIKQKRVWWMIISKIRGIRPSNKF